MIRRFFQYCQKVFHLSQLVERLEDGRKHPAIPAGGAWLSLCLLFLLRLGSLNALEQIIRNPHWRGRWKRLLRGKPPSADTLGYFAQRLSLDSLRAILHDLYTSLQRNHHLTSFRFGGWTVLAVDGHELFTSYRRRCSHCLTRKVVVGGKEKTQYYHRIAVACLVGGPVLIPLDIEEQRPGEDETGAALRLLERIQRRYPKAFDVVTADALYANPRILALLRSHHKHLVAVLKDNHPDLLTDAKSLCQGTPLLEESLGKGEYQWWDLEGFSSWSSVKDPVRVVRSHETKPVRGERVSSDWYWVTTLSLAEAATQTIWRIGHARWEIENQGFNQLVNQLHFNRPYHHHPNAIMVFVLTACIVLLLLSAFHQFNLKAELRERLSLAALALDFLQTLFDLLRSTISLLPIRAPT